MKVLLKQDIENLGRMGEIVDVAGGYARNFLMPKDLAVSISRGNIKEIERQRQVLEARALRVKEASEGVASKVRDAKIIIKERCSASGKLFGSVTNRRIAQEIESMTGEEIDRHKIIVDDKIREVGTYKATIKLHPDVVFDIDFGVEGEGFHPEEQTEEGETVAAEEEKPDTSPSEDDRIEPVDESNDSVEASEKGDEDSKQG
ncbi:MAG: 50S ribosomal protein L9 [Actinobacteria bacterium]|nr:50S ribosomal protein L9 [Actinomycetota bacterium]